MDPVTLGMAKSDAAKKYARPAPFGGDTRPWYLDAYWQFFNGMSRVATQVSGASSPLAVASVVGGTTLTVVDGSQFVVNEPIIVGGQGFAPYSPGQLYTVLSIAANVLTVTPLIGEVNPVGATVGGCWYNDSHIYGQGIASLAAWMANAKRGHVMPGTSLINTGSFETNYTDVNGVANVPVGWESLTSTTTCTRFTGWNTSGGPQYGRTGFGLLLGGSAVGTGIRTLPAIAVTPGMALNISAQMAGSYAKLEAWDKALGVPIANSVYSREQQFTPLGYGRATRFGERQYCQFTVPAGVTSLEVRITSLAASAPVNVDDVRIVIAREDPSVASRYVFEDDPRGLRPIVWMGDSWANAGVIAFTSALAARMGHAVTVLDKGISGQRLDGMIARFATDAVPNNPSYVIWEWGVNDVYAGYSNATMVANMTTATNLTRAIGAVPVHVGVPPLVIFPQQAHDANDALRAKVDSSAV